MSLPIAFETGPADLGWADFRVAVGAGSWSLPASYLGDHPVAGLVDAVTMLHLHYTEPQMLDDDGSLRRVAIHGEPEILNIEIRALDGWRLAVRIGLEEGPGGKDDLQWVAEAEIGFWEFAEAVALDAARAVGRQGFAGVHHGWIMRWELPVPVLDAARVFHVLALARHHEARLPGSLAEEIALLEHFAELAA